MSGHRTYDVAAAALLLLTAAFAAIVFLCALCMARRRGDAARSWLAHYKLGFGFFVLSVTLSFFSHLLAVVYGQLYAAAFKARATRVVSDIFRAHLETAIIGSFLEEVAFILILLALVRLAAGIKTAHGGVETTSERVLRAGLYVTALLLVALNTAGFALRERHFTTTYINRDLLKDGIVVPKTIWHALRTPKALALAILVFQLLATVALLARSILVARHTRSEPRVKTPTRYLLACCTLLLLRASYDIGFYAHHVPCDDVQSVVTNAASTQPGLYFAVIGIVLSCWPLFIVLVLLFVLATKNQDGLWSTDQPFRTVRPGGQGATLQTPWGYEYRPESQQPLHPSWQQPQALENPHAGPHGQPAPLPYQPPPHNASAQSAHYPSPSPPPPHSDAMGLYHQADGLPPQTSPLPYDKK